MAAEERAAFVVVSEELSVADLVLQENEGEGVELGEGDRGYERALHVFFKHDVAPQHVFRACRDRGRLVLEAHVLPVQVQERQSRLRRY